MKETKKSLRFAERLRYRRAELRWTRPELQEKVESRGHPVSAESLRNMENVSNRYRLPTRGKGEAIQWVAEALGVPFGYFLDGFSQQEIDRSVFGPAVAEGRIILVPELRATDRTTFADFLMSLPENEQQLMSLPLYTFRNEKAFAIVAKFERIYSGLEMLVVNEPPLIFWDEEDVSLWVGNMLLNDADSRTFQAEFRAYRTFFRELLKNKKKRYKVVLNMATFLNFLRKKTSLCRRQLVQDMIQLLTCPLFDLVLSESPHSEPLVGVHQEMMEREVLSKFQSVPDALHETISIQILQTPSDRKPVEYFVYPTPPNRDLLQREKAFIDAEWARAVDNYETRYRQKLGVNSIFDDAQVKQVTVQILGRLLMELQ